MKSNYYTKTAKFYYLLGDYWISRRLCSALVATHVRLTPVNAAGSIADEIMLEFLRTKIRKLEFRCHSRRLAFTDLGKDLLREETEAEETPLRESETTEEESAFS